MIQNTCKLRTNNFYCDCCDEHNCQRYIAYQQGRADAIKEFEFIWGARVKDLINWCKDKRLEGLRQADFIFDEIAEKLKEQNND